MPTDHRAITVDHGAGPRAGSSGHELLPAPACDEADVHALRLGGGPQPEARRVVAHLSLRELADREQRPVELGLPEHVEDVRLVLGGIEPAAQLPAAGVVTADPSVVAGGNGVEPERVGPLEQPAELDRPVALHTRIGCAAVGIRVHVGPHDTGLEVVGEVEHVMRDVELGGDAAGVFDVGGAAASGVGLAAPQLERHTRDVVPGVAQKRGGDGRVDPAAHRDQHAGRGGHRDAVTAGRSRSTARGMSSSAASTSVSVDA